MLEAKGRVVMITGANRGIGRAVAERLHALGYSLSLGARDLDRLNTASAAFAPERTLLHAFDAKNRAVCKRWVEATVDRFGRIDGLINNAGIALPTAIESEDEDAFDELWQVNCMGPLRVIRLALPHLKASGSGRVINVASLSGKRVANTGAGYAMSKFALIALTHALRRIGFEHGIRATALCPSFVATDMTSQVTSFAQADMIDPADLAELAATILALPNTAAIAEVLVNCRHEDMI
jgi:NADP-dependent 3-hydroxy acid dehydrogenase YdfG